MFDKEVKNFDTLICEYMDSNLIANRSISDFFDKLLLYLKTRKNIVVTYNILDEIITSMKTVKYIYNELDTIKDILNEFKVLGKEKMLN